MREANDSSKMKQHSIMLMCVLCAIYASKLCGFLRDLCMFCASLMHVWCNVQMQNMIRKVTRTK